MTYQTFSQAWLGELESILLNGEGTAPRGMVSRELRWRQLQVAEPLTFPVAAFGRDFRDVIGVLEGLSLVGQVSIPETFTRRVAKFAEYLDDGVFHGAYGARVAGSLGEVVALLERDPDSRQAVVTIFDSTRDLNRVKRDIPCTVALHFMQRRHDLELNVTMRSNDAWLGMPYDFTQFAILQASMAQALGLFPGLYTHSTGSLHLYDRDFEKVDRVLEERDELFQPLERMAFPLWGCEDDIGAISARARSLLLDPRRFSAVGRTEFEWWAQDLLVR
jgi:thymidylate synthase